MVILSPFNSSLRYGVGMLHVDNSGWDMTCCQAMHAIIRLIAFVIRDQCELLQCGLKKVSESIWASWGMSECELIGKGDCRSPEKPGTMLIKRLLALEGDWVTVPGRMEVEKIPKVC